jgi:hypothetical protein
MVINKLIDLNDEKIMNQLDRNSTFQQERIEVGEKKYDQYHDS